MFYYLKGELSALEASFCVIDCGGVGYKLTISLYTAELLSDKLGEEVKLYTELSVREDGVELFGFNSAKERLTYNLLTSVSGVGPKAAINVLSVLSPEKLAMAICTEDIKAISKAQNVGSKTAARIVLELRDKIAKEMPSDASPLTTRNISASVAINRGNTAEAAEALMALGYDKTTVSNALNGLDSKLDVGELIRLALKKLSF